MRLISYELNEVPWRVVDYYVARRPDSNLRRMLDNAVTLTTETRDTGELHPWTTWPTVHRGVYNSRHGITFLNQEIDGGYPSLWELAARSGVSVGVFGSLQSWPPPAEEDPLADRYVFFVPDTFAPDPTTRPRRYESFQQFNLAQTRRDGAVAKSVGVGPGTLGTVGGLLRTGLRGRTVAQLALQLARERLDPVHRTRRPVFQAPVAFDFFLDAYERGRPELCTFFTNHCAGIMHRYWKYAFPEDFGFELQTAEDRFRGESLMFAMDEADRILGTMMRLADRDGAVLVVHASMGQEAVERGEYVGELRLDDPSRLFTVLGFDRPYRQSLAMQPDFAFVLDSAADCERLEQCIGRLLNEDGTPVCRIKRTERTLNMGLKAAPQSVQAERLWVGDAEHRAAVAIHELGISRIHRDPGTGYHQPRGMAAFYRRGLVADDARTLVESVRIAPTVLQLFGAERPDYMLEPVERVLTGLEASPSYSER